MGAGSLEKMSQAGHGMVRCPWEGDADILGRKEDHTSGAWRPDAGRVPVVPGGPGECNMPEGVDICVGIKVHILRVTHLV